MNIVHKPISRIHPVTQAENEQRSQISPPPNKTRPSTVARAAELREALLAAGMDCLTTQGLAGISARGLAAQVGCSIGQIYKVYGDLDQLILGLNARTLEEIDAAMAAVTETGPRARLLALGNAYLDYAVANPLRWDALFAFRMPPGTPLPDWFLSLRERAFSRLVAPLTEMLPYPADGFTALGRSLFAAVHGMVALGLGQKLGPVEKTALRCEIIFMVTVILDGLQAPQDP